MLSSKNRLRQHKKTGNHERSCILRHLNHTNGLVEAEGIDVHLL